MSLKEYIVTLRDFNDLGSFYDDMETPGGNLYIPHRAVEVVHRRNISRNTHYMLTQEEAELVKKDSRVLDVSLNPEDDGLKFLPCNIPIQSSSNWNKSIVLSSTDQNWGLIKCYGGYDSFMESTSPSYPSYNNWGSDGSPNITGDIHLTMLGRNVDVVIVDGILLPGHPQWRSFDDPNVSRSIRLDWYQYNSIVGAFYTGSYPYDTLLNTTTATGNHNHGNHVAGTVAGYTYGWAKCANIYNIYPYDSTYVYVLDWIRAFHKNKAINPVTGRKNPTIVNMSYTLVNSGTTADITDIYYQGRIYKRPINGWGNIDLTNFGINNNGLSTSHCVRATFIDADIIDCINEGIVLVGAAGNYNTYVDVIGGRDYNNYFVQNGSNIFYHRGSSQAAAPGSICVGAIDSTVLNKKASFSNSGPRIDIFAPGVNITSAVKYRDPQVAVYDPLQNGYFIDKLSGTSMASPQVAGVLACHAENMQNMDQQDALNLLIRNSRKNTIATAPFDSTYPSTSISYAFGLRNAPNRYLRFLKQKPQLDDSITTYTGIYYPLRNHNIQYKKGILDQVPNFIDPVVTKDNIVETIFSTRIYGDTRTKSRWTSFLSTNGLKFNYGETINNTYSINLPRDGIYDFRFAVDYYGTVTLDGTNIFTGATPYETYNSSIFLKAGLHVIKINAVFLTSALSSEIFAVALTVTYNSKVRDGVVYPRPKIRVRG